MAMAFPVGRGAASAAGQRRAGDFALTDGGKSMHTARPFGLLAPGAPGLARARFAHERLALRSRRQSRPSPSRLGSTAEGVIGGVPEEAPSDKASDSSAVMSAAKAIMGAGTFAVPWAFANGGLVLTSISLVVSLLMSLNTLSYIVRAKREALALNGESPTKLFEDGFVGIADYTMGSKGGSLVKVVMCITAFGVCTAYFIFVASTLATIGREYAAPAVFQSDKALVWVCSPLMMGLAWLRSVSGLSLISVLGNVSVLVGMSVVIADALSGPTYLSALPLFAPSKFGAYVGSVAFLFLVHFALPDIEVSMRNPKNFQKACTAGYGICALVCFVFGLVGAIGYGPGVSSVAVAMLKGGAIATGTKLLLCVNVLATFPLIVRSSFVTIESALGGEISMMASNALRTVYVLAAALCAVSIPSFGRVIGLVGGVACVFLSLVVPPLMLMSVNKLSQTKTGKDIMSGVDKASCYFFIVLAAVIAFFIVICP